MGENLRRMEAKYVITVILVCTALGMVAGLLFYAAFKDPNAVTFCTGIGFAYGVAVVLLPLLRRGNG